LHFLHHRTISSLITSFRFSFCEFISLKLNPFLDRDIDMLIHSVTKIPSYLILSSTLSSYQCSHSDPFLMSNYSSGQQISSINTKCSWWVDNLLLSWNSELISFPCRSALVKVCFRNNFNLISIAVQFW
jgi:hypothetical protein